MWWEWQSARVQSVMVCVNVLVLLFVAAVGLWAGFAHGWKGYEQSEGYSTISLSFQVNLQEFR